MSTKKEQETIKFQLELAHTRGIALGRDQGKLEACETLWKVFHEAGEYYQSQTNLRVLDDLKDKLRETLPYGPDEVY